MISFKQSTSTLGTCPPLFIGLVVCVILGACSRSTPPPVNPPPPQKIVWNYNNGWWHTADGVQSIARIAKHNRRDTDLVAVLNRTTVKAIPSRGTRLYIPPVNDRDAVREVLRRIRNRPDLVPPVPWNYQTGAPSAANDAIAIKTPSAHARKVAVAPRPNNRPIDKRPPPSAAKRNTRTHSPSPSIKRTDAVTASPRSSAKRPRTTASSGPFQWPVEGEIVNRFKAGWFRNPLHGIEIAADEGSPVCAARDGKVLWANDKLPGYGRLIIIDHLDGFSSVYGYNKEVHVRYGERVRTGQRIASVGRPSLHAQPKLFFEIRRDGSPVDPLKYLN